MQNFRNGWLLAVTLILVGAAFFYGRPRASPENIRSYLDLSYSYLQVVRETADSSYYVKIDDLADAAEALDPKNAEVSALRASTALGRHHFKEAHIFAKEAVALDPNRALFRGLLGDSEIELGHYDAAVASFQKMIDIRPDFSSYSRTAYLRELYGDVPGAQAALRSAISAGSKYPENVAWAYVELAKLDMRTSLNAAKKDLRDSLATQAEYPPALELLGKVAFFEG